MIVPQCEDMINRFVSAEVEVESGRMFTRLGDSAGSLIIITYLSFDTDTIASTTVAATTILHFLCHGVAWCWLGHAGSYCTGSSYTTYLALFAST